MSRKQTTVVLASSIMASACYDANFPLSPKSLVMRPAAIDFGTIPSGTEATETIDLTNSGQSALTIQGIHISGSDAFSWSGVTTPLQLQREAIRAITVQFRATDERDLNAQLVITADDREITHFAALRGGATFELPPGDEPDPEKIPGDAGSEMPDTGTPMTPDAGVPMELDAGEPKNPDDVVPPAAGRYLYYWRVGPPEAGGFEPSDIMRLPLQAGGEAELFFGESAGDGCPGCHKVSPDGRYIAIVQFLVGLAVIDTSTREQVSITAEAIDATSISWRPDVRSDPPYQFVYSAFGRLHKASVTEGYLGELSGANDPASSQVMPSWGAAGKIAFVRGQPDLRQDWVIAGTSDIMLIDERGGTAEPLTGASENGRTNYYPSFSPNAEWIGFTQSSLGTSYAAPDARLSLVKADNSGVIQDLPRINALGRSRSYTEWSIDGDYLGFSVSRGNGMADWDLYIVPIDPMRGIETGAPTPVTSANGTGFEHGLEWSP